MLLVRLACVKASSHLDGMAQPHDSPAGLVRFLGTDGVISRALFRERGASGGDSGVDGIGEGALWSSPVKYSSPRRASGGLATSSISAPDIIAIPLRVDEENNRGDCVAGWDSELIGRADMFPSPL